MDFHVIEITLKCRHCWNGSTTSLATTTYQTKLGAHTQPRGAGGLWAHPLGQNWTENLKCMHLDLFCYICNSHIFIISIYFVCNQHKFQMSTKMHEIFWTKFEFQLSMTSLTYAAGMYIHNQNTRTSCVSSRINLLKCIGDSDHSPL